MQSSSSSSSSSSSASASSPPPALPEKRDSVAPSRGPSYVVPFGRLHEVFTLIVRTHYQYDLISRCANHYIAALTQFKNNSKAKTDLSYTEQDINVAIAALRRLVWDLKNAVEPLQSFVIKINATRAYQIARSSPHNLSTISTSTHFLFYLLLAEWIISNPLFPFLRKTMTIVQLHSNQRSTFNQVLLPILNSLKSDDAALAGHIAKLNGTMITTHYSDKVAPLPSGIPSAEPTLPAGAATDLVDLIAQPVGMAPRFYPMIRDCIIACLKALEEMIPANPVIDDYCKRVTQLRNSIRSVADESDQFAPPTDHEEVLRLLTQMREREKALELKMKASEKEMALREKAVVSKEKELKLKEKELKALESRLTQQQHQTVQTSSSSGSEQKATLSVAQKSQARLFMDDDDDIFADPPPASGKGPAAPKSTSLFDEVEDELAAAPVPPPRAAVKHHSIEDVEDLFGALEDPFAGEGGDHKQRGARTKQSFLFDVDDADDQLMAASAPPSTAAKAKAKHPSIEDPFEGEDIEDLFADEEDDRKTQPGGKHQAQQAQAGVPDDQDDDFLKEMQKAITLSLLDMAPPTPGTPTPSPQSPSIAGSLQPGGSHLLASARPSTAPSSSSSQPSSSRHPKVSTKQTPHTPQNPFG